VLRSALDEHGFAREIAEELGVVLREARKWPQAAKIYQSLVEQHPDSRSMRDHLVYALALSGRPAQAVDVALESSLQGAQRAEALSASADAVYEMKRLGIAAVLYREAYAADPDSFAAKVGLSQVFRSQVPRWHFGMLNDAARNKAYEEAIGRTVHSGDIVLEIGTGAGLLAMMAARAGAGHVYTCESVGAIAQKAQEIIAGNGLSSQITVLPKWSTALRAGSDLPRRADVLICEIADNLLIGEGMLAAIAHARSDLLVPNARLLPGSGRVLVEPVEAPNLHSLDRIGQVSGFDLSAFNEFSRFGNLSVESVREGDFEPLGDAAEAFRFDFTDGPFQSESKRLDMVCCRAGELHGLLVWFELSLAADITIGNYPGRDGDHWGHALFLVDRPRTVAAGETLRIVARHDTTTIDMSVE
jgi:hypothetical protein